MADADAREQALARVKAKRGLRTTAATLAIVAVLLVAIWAVTGRGFFWPVFPLIGFAIALAFQGYSVYGEKPITDEEVEREMDRERGAG